MISAIAEVTIVPNSSGAPWKVSRETSQSLPKTKLSAEPAERVFRLADQANEEVRQQGEDGRREDGQPHLHDLVR